MQTGIFLFVTGYNFKSENRLVKWADCLVLVPPKVLEYAHENLPRKFTFLCVLTFNFSRDISPALRAEKKYVIV